MINGSTIAGLVGHKIYVETVDGREKAIEGLLLDYDSVNWFVAIGNNVRVINVTEVKKVFIEREKVVVVEPEMKTKAKVEEPRQEEPKPEPKTQPKPEKPKTTPKSAPTKPTVDLSEPGDDEDVIATDDDFGDLEL